MYSVEIGLVCTNHHETDTEEANGRSHCGIRGLNQPAFLTKRYKHYLSHFWQVLSIKKKKGEYQQKKGRASLMASIGPLVAKEKEERGENTCRIKECTAGW